MAGFSLLLMLVAAAIARADDILVYQDGALASQWQDWSWSSTISYAATDIAEGSSSISVTSQAWSALSLYYPTPFGSYAGLEFDIAVSACRHGLCGTADANLGMIGRATGHLYPAYRRHQQRELGVHSALCVQHAGHGGRLHARSAQLRECPSEQPALSKCSSHVFGECLADTLSKGTGAWDRITFQAGGNGASVSKGKICGPRRNSCIPLPVPP